MKLSDIQRILPHRRPLAIFILPLKNISSGLLKFLGLHLFWFFAWWRKNFLQECIYANQSAIYALRTNDGGQLWRTPIGLLQPTPAPTPTAESGDSGGIRLTKTGIPAFTVADVERYFAKHPTLTTAGKPGKIVKIEFITSKEASVLMKGESTGLPDDALVCYVELNGPFVLDVSVPMGAKLPQSQDVYYVFDAQTAKSLVFGTVG